MGKKDELLSGLGSNMAESLGQGERSREPIGRSMSSFDGRRLRRDIGEIDITRIIPDPDQPRRTFPDDEIQQLSESIQAHGMMQPIRVRWDQAAEKWRIISGERRFRAARRAGLAALPCVFVDDEKTASTVLVEQLVENCQREELRPVEQAEAFSRLRSQTGWSTQQLADRLKLSKATVVRSLALLKLPEDIQRQVDTGELAASSAYALSQLPQESEQRNLASIAKSDSLTRAEVNLLVREATPQGLQKRSHPLSQRTGSTTRSWRLATGKVTVQLNKDSLLVEDFVETLQDALRQVTDELEATKNTLQASPIEL